MVDAGFWDYVYSQGAQLSLGQVKKLYWPNVRFYDKQWEIIHSVEQNDVTVVPAGNKLGKDFVTGFICLAAFLAWDEVRIITTSVKDDHLRVLWGEIGRFVDTAEFPLRVEEGGPLIVNHREIRKVRNGQKDTISYLLGMVSKKGEGMAGHHAKHTLLVGDEASGLDDHVMEFAEGWMKKGLLIGNPHPCNNFFRRLVDKGDVLAV